MHLSVDCDRLPHIREDVTLGHTELREQFDANVEHLFLSAESKSRAFTGSIEFGLYIFLQSDKHLFNTRAEGVPHMFKVNQVENRAVIDLVNDQRGLVLLQGRVPCECLHGLDQLLVGSHLVTIVLQKDLHFLEQPGDLINVDVVLVVPHIRRWLLLCWQGLRNRHGDCGTLVLFTF